MVSFWNFIQRKAERLASCAGMCMGRWDGRKDAIIWKTCQEGTESVNLPHTISGQGLPHATNFAHVNSGLAGLRSSGRQPSLGLGRPEFESKLYPILPLVFGQVLHLSKLSVFLSEMGPVVAL